MRGVIRVGLVAAFGLGIVGCVTDPVSHEKFLSVCAPKVTVAPVSQAAALTVLGQGPVTSRYSGEVDALGTTAYTTTWAGLPRTSGVPGNAVFIWDVSGNVPVLIDSIIVATSAATLGDVAISDDGKLLVVATEYTGGSIVIYDITAPRAPKLISRFSNTTTNPGVHTAEIGRVNGHLYGFLSIDPRGTTAAKLVIVDLADPAQPVQIFSKAIGTPYVHDTYLRDGILFLALWDDGIEIWDLGGAGNGSPSAPRVISALETVNGEAHNIWWYHDPSGVKPYAFVGEEGPGDIGSFSDGDIHVVDVCDLANPKEVAFYHRDGAGTHNFSMDESRGILYAAYYNGGVRAIDVRGDLGDCPDSQRADDGRCDLAKMGREIATGVASQSNRYVWGVVYRAGYLYLSDMINGLWKLKAVGTP
jgi:hypothetical protein